MCLAHGVLKPNNKTIISTTYPVLILRLRKTLNMSPLGGEGGAYPVLCILSHIRRVPLVVLSLPGGSCSDGTHGTKHLVS